MTYRTQANTLAEKIIVTTRLRCTSCGSDDVATEHTDTRWDIPLPQHHSQCLIIRHMKCRDCGWKFKNHVG